MVYTEIDDALCNGLLPHEQGETIVPGQLNIQLVGGGVEPESG